MANNIIGKVRIATGNVKIKRKYTAIYVALTDNGIYDYTYYDRIYNRELKGCPLEKHLSDTYKYKGKRKHK